VLKRVQGIAITRLTSADVVRHPLVARIVDAYDKSPPVVTEIEAATGSIAPLARTSRARSRNGS
jgi:phosphate starvation-inducible PhoH-like protein